MTTKLWLDLTTWKIIPEWLYDKGARHKLIYFSFLCINFEYEYIANYIGDINDTDTCCGGGCNDRHAEVTD